jgi:hypothetical protein
VVVMTNKSLLSLFIANTGKTTIPTKNYNPDIRDLCKYQRENYNPKNQEV